MAPKSTWSKIGRNTITYFTNGPLDEPLLKNRKSCIYYLHALKYIFTIWSMLTAYFSLGTATCQRQGTLKGFEKISSIFRNVNFRVVFHDVRYLLLWVRNEDARIHNWRYLVSFGDNLSYSSKAVFGVAIWLFQISWFSQFFQFTRTGNIISK